MTDTTPDAPPEEPPADPAPDRPDERPHDPAAPPSGEPDATPPPEPESYTQPDQPDAPATPPADGIVIHGDPDDPNTRGWVATPETTVDGQPAVQQGTKTGPAAGPSPDAGGTTQD